jgi:iron complex transport system substrate-binding protein
VDASSYFSRPGPRLVEGIELMASILHPAIFGVPDRDRARRVTPGRRTEPALHA